MVRPLVTMTVLQLKPWPLYDVLTEKYEWEPSIARGKFRYSPRRSSSPHLSEFADWLLPMLSYDPAERASALECIKHPFLAELE